MILLSKSWIDLMNFLSMDTTANAFSRSSVIVLLKKVSNFTLPHIGCELTITTKQKTFFYIFIALFNHQLN